MGGDDIDGPVSDVDLRVEGGAAHRGRVHGGVVDLDRAQTRREHRHLLHPGELET
jgi:hypothetical protein